MHLIVGVLDQGLLNNLRKVESRYTDTARSHRGSAMARMSSSRDSDYINGGSPRGRPSHGFPRATRSYQCKVCGNEFSSGQSLGGHMNVHRRYQSDSTPPRRGNHYSSTAEYNSSSTYKGVRYRSEQNKWVAEIRPPKSSRTWWLGTYATAIEAAHAYDVAITYFGSETSLNFDGHPVYDQIPRIASDLPAQDFASQLRRVVKEYGKRAMQSEDPTSHNEDEEVEQSEEEEVEEEGSSSSCAARDLSSSSPGIYNSFYDGHDVVNQSTPDHFDDQTIDWDDAFPEPAFPADDQTFNPNYDAPFDFDMHPGVAYENYSHGAYQPTLPSDYYEPPSSGTSYYNHGMSGSDQYYNTGGHNHSQILQSTMWSPVYSSYNQYCPDY